MSNTSATGGYLTPSASPAPLEGDAYLDFIQAWIVGITGIAGQLVRPRWQPEPPNIPNAQTDWIAFGIIKRDADTFAAELHYPSGQGYNTIRRHEIIHLLASFYGPNGDQYAGIFRDGAQLGQHEEVLANADMGLVETGEIIVAPEMLKEKWLYRTDLHFSIRRQVVRKYEILDLASANGILNNEHYETLITVEEP